ncbi:MAG: hypothetical protein PHI86_03345 [Candidatus Omnitrophica bacterium]|nr:hypothetical protein [Candidatus Omnitrophota bacterium]HOX54373.1 hypothetical protein [Candidatus Omnitrophota bacterium]
MKYDNPFKDLKPALELITKEAKVLPATGQAMEDMVRPDHAEVIDRLRMGDDNYFEVLLETPNRSPYVQLTPFYRQEKHMLRYFIDGSARTFFLGDVVEGKRRTSIHVSQIGSACVYRQDNGHVNVAKSCHKIILMMDKKSVSFGDQVEELVKKAGDRFAFCDIQEEDGETERTSPGKEPRSRAPHKAHHLMAKLEEELGRDLKRGKNHWLIMDGNAGKDLYMYKDIPNICWLNKSFSKEPTFQLQGGKLGSKTVNLYELLADLPYSSRTCAFSARSGDAAIWFLRLREQKQMDYPLMGVVKVELPNPSKEAVSSDIINELSSALLAERQATPHGKDSRWHAHIYAIYLAEQAVKNGFISTEALKAGLKWPFKV